MASRPTILLFFSLALLLHAPPSSANSSAPSPSPSTTDFDFIFQSCNHTLYPDVCYTSLSHYANSIRQNSYNLARAAINACLSESRLVSAYFSNLARKSSDSTASVDCRAALRDCSSTLSAAASQIRDSFKQMCQIGVGAPAVRFQISNVQTWMSAALTNEDTCTDGFEGVQDGPVKSDVCDRVTRVRKLTSNALALVNFYASSLGQ